MSQPRLAPSVAIVGPYIMHNFGDDLVGAVLTHFLQEQFHAQVLLPSLSQQNCHWLGIPAVATNRDAILTSQAILIGGGGILGDSGVSAHNGYLLSAGKAALFGRIARRRVIVSGVGAGPLARRSSRILCRTICDLVSAIGVRDRASAQFLVREMGVSPTKVVLGSDVALLWPKAFQVAQQRLNTIGVQFDAWTYSSAQENPFFADIIKCLVDFCNARAEEVTLVSNASRATQLHHHLEYAPRSLHYSLLPSFLSRLSGLRAILTSHLHLAIAAFAARVPCYSIYVKEKTKRFYEQIGRTERAIDIASAKPVEVERLLNSVQEACWTDEDELILCRLQSDATRLIDICSLLFEEAHA